MKKMKKAPRMSEGPPVFNRLESRLSLGELQSGSFGQTEGVHKFPFFLRPDLRGVWERNRSGVSKEILGSLAGRKVLTDKVHGRLRTAPLILKFRRWDLVFREAVHPSLRLLLAPRTMLAGVALRDHSDLALRASVFLVCRSGPDLNTAFVLDGELALQVAHCSSPFAAMAVCPNGGNNIMG